MKGLNGEANILRAGIRAGVDDRMYIALTISMFPYLTGELVEQVNFSGILIVNEYALSNFAKGMVDSSRG
ncbi:MAG: hypothetical protein ACI97B_001306, partial [Verrucomicrobiales bacterium]